MSHIPLYGLGDLDQRVIRGTEKCSETALCCWVVPCSANEVDTSVMETLRRCCTGPFLTHSPKVMEVKAGSKQAYTRRGVCCDRDLLCCVNLERGDLPGSRPGRAARHRASGCHVALLGANQRHDIKPPPSIRVDCVISCVAGRGRKLLALTPGGVDWF